MEDTKPKRGRPRKYPELPTTTEPRRPRGRPRKYTDEPKDDSPPQTTRDKFNYEWKKAHADKWREYQRKYQREYRLRNLERCNEIRKEYAQRKKEWDKEHKDDQQ